MIDGGHGHAHAHPAAATHAHDHGPPAAPAEGAFTAAEARQARRLGLVLGLVSMFFVVELGGAIMAESVVLQADAIHLLMDVLALGVSLFAMRLAVRRPTPRLTYGLRRAEPVAAIFSGLLVLVTTGLIVAEAIEALRGGGAPRPGVMLVVAIGALVVNGTSAWLLHDVIGHAHPHPPDPNNPDDLARAGEHDDDHDHDDDHGHEHHRAHGHALNLRGAWLHLLGDALGALAAVCAALVIRLGGPVTADPIASFIVAGILLAGSVRLLRDATFVLLEGAPRHLPIEAVSQIVLGFPGVTGMHDLHVWTLGAGHDAVTVHVCSDSTDPTLGQRLSSRLRDALAVEYVAVQVEVGGGMAGAGPTCATTPRARGPST
jgi:cation diffusion facilitator family transporter